MPAGVRSALGIEMIEVQEMWSLFLPTPRLRGSPIVIERETTVVRKASPCEGA
jgi:hypothetical protein